MFSGYSWQVDVVTRIYHLSSFIHHLKPPKYYITSLKYRNCHFWELRTSTFGIFPWKWLEYWFFFFFFTVVQFAGARTSHSFSLFSTQQSFKGLKQRFSFCGRQLSTTDVFTIFMIFFNHFSCINKICIEPSLLHAKFVSISQWRVITILMYLGFGFKENLYW